MKIFDTSIPEVKLVEPTVYGDHRGFFMETWQRQRFTDHGIDVDFVQDNHSKSLKGTLRGLHYQVDSPQGKLIRVIAGEVYDIAVDLRASSPSFGHWVGATISADNKRQLWVPEGFAHGFYVTSPTAEVVYKCTSYYAPEFERCIVWNDSDLAIDWPLAEESPLLSEKDAAAPAFRDAEKFP